MGFTLFLHFAFSGSPLKAGLLAEIISEMARCIFSRRKMGPGEMVNTLHTNNNLLSQLINKYWNYSTKQ